MFPGEVLGSGHIEVGVDDAGVAAGLRKVEAQVKASLAKIAAEEAEAKIGADLSEFRRKVAEAKRELKALDKQRANPDISPQQKSALTRRINAAQKELEAAQAGVKASAQELRNHKAIAQQKAFDRRKEEQHNKLANAQLAAELNAVKRQRAERQAAAEEEARSARARAKFEEEADADRRRRAQERERAAWAALTLAEKNAKAEAKAEEAAKRRAEIERTAQERAEAAHQRELSRVPEMQREQAKLQRRIDSHEARMRRARTRQDRIQIELDTTAAMAKMAVLRAALEALGEKPIEIDFHPARTLGAQMNTQLRRAYEHGGLRAASYDAGQMAGALIARGIGNGVRNNLSRQGLKSNIAGGLVRTGDAISNAAGRLSSMSVRLGPFTTSVRGAIGALALLGPMLVDVVGALGALGAVTGSAVLGLGQLGAGILGGAVPAFLGMGLVIKDVVQDFASFKKAQKAYDDAVAKNGKSSDQAKKKLEELNRITGGLSETTQAQIRNARVLGASWDQATRPGRASVWKAVGNALEGATNMMPMFAQKTNKALSVAEQGLSRWVKGLSSAGGQAVLGTLMDNFNSGLGRALTGLGQFTAYLGKVGAYASSYFPSMTNQFGNWAKRLNDSADGSQTFTHKIDTAIDSLKTFGRFTQAAGRFTTTFFSAGTEAGQGFLDTMTKTLNRWDAFYSSSPGRNSLRDFFEESVAGAKSLYGFIKPIATGFVAWSTALAPVARTFFDGVGAVMSFVTALLKVTALKGPISALAFTLGSLWAVNRIGAATRALFGFSAALMGVSRANAAVAGSSTAATAAQARQAAAARGAGAASVIAAGAAGATARGATARRAPVAPLIIPPGQVRQAQVAAQAVQKFGNAGKYAVTALTALGGVLGGGLFAGAAIAAGAAGFAVYKYATRTRDWEKSAAAAAKETTNWQKQSAVLNQGNMELANSTLQAESAALSYKQAQSQAKTEERELATLRKQGKKNTDEYAQAELNHRQTLLGLRSARLQDINARRTQQQMYKDEKKAINESLYSAGRAAAATRKSVSELGSKGGFAGGEKLADHFKRVEASAKAAGVGVEEFIRKGNFGTKGRKDDLLEYAAAVDKNRTAQQNLQRAMDQTALESVNLERAMQGMAAIGPKAAKIFGDLQRKTGNNKLSLNISTKFTNPNEASRVAASTRKTLQQGSNQKIVTRIIADSSNAEEAIRRLKAARIDNKKLKVIAEGGPEAVSMLRQIAGVKLSKKEAQIVSKGGPAAMAVIKRVAGADIAEKILKIMGDPSSAMAAVAKANGMTVKQLTQAIRRVFDTGSGPTPPPTTQTVHRRFVGGGGVGHDSYTRAMGGIRFRAAGGADAREETVSTLSAQERAFDKVQKGTIVRRSPTQLQGGARINTPMAVYGEEPTHTEYMITDNPSYRKSNIRYLMMAAKRLGVEMAAKGKAPMPFVAKDRYQPTFASAPKAKPGKWGTPATRTVMANVEEAKRVEGNYSYDLETTISNLKEPDSFLTQTGIDPVTKEPIWSFNRVSQQAWEATIAGISARFSKLVNLNSITMQKVNEAGTVVQQVKKNAKANIKNAQDAADAAHARKKKYGSKKSGAAYKNAVKDFESAQNKLDNARSTREEADTALKSLEEEHEDTFRRRGSYVNNWSEYESNARTAAGETAAEGNSPSGSGGDGGADAPETPTPGAGTAIYDGTRITGYVSGTGNAGSGNSPADLAVARAEADLSKSEAGLAGSLDKTTAINNAITAQRSKLAEGESMLKDDDKANDAQGYQTIASAASAIKSYEDQLKDASGQATTSLKDAANQLYGGAVSIKEMFKQYGSNIYEAINSGMGAAAATQRTGQMTIAALSPSAGRSIAAGVQMGTIGGGGSGDTYITIDQTFEKQPENPHLWAQQQAFELRSAIG